MTIKKAVCWLLLAAVMLGIAGCKSSHAGTTLPASTPEDRTTEPTQPDASEVIGWQGVHALHRPGERFEAVIMLEGMEEAVQAEHVECAEGTFCLDIFWEDFECILSEDLITLVWKYSLPDTDPQFLQIAWIASSDFQVLEEDMHKRMQSLGTPFREDVQLAGYEAVRMTVTSGNLHITEYCLKTEYGCISVRMQCTLEAAEGVGGRMHRMLSSLQIKNQG